MKRMIYHVTFISCLALIITVGGVPCASQTVANDLLDQQIELHITNGSLIYALSKLAVVKRVPIGLESSLSYKEKDNLNIDVNNVKLKDVLDMIVKQNPDYSWETRDGVINFVPTDSRDKFIEKLLNTRVHIFAPKKGLGKFGIRDAITDLPEIQSLLKANGITASHYGYFYRPSIYSNNKVDLSISGTDVRGVLNKVIKESEHKLWVIERSGKNKEFLDIGF